MYSVQCTVYSVWCSVYSVQCTVYIVQCTVYGVQGTQNLTLKGSEEHLFTNNQDSINTIFIVETQKHQPGVCGVKSRKLGWVWVWGYLYGRFNPNPNRGLGLKGGFTL